MARKTQRKYSRSGNNEDELDLRNDEEYDGFLDDDVVDSVWTDGIHTFFVLDTDGKYQTYNNDLRREKTKDYQSISHYS